MNTDIKSRSNKHLEGHSLSQWLVDNGVYVHPLTSMIKSVDFIDVPEHQLFVAVLCLDNGHVEVAESRPINPAEFVVTVGEIAAFTNARNNLWPKIAYGARLTGDLKVSTRMRNEINVTRCYVSGVSVDNNGDCLRVEDQLANMWSIYIQDSSGRETAIADYATRAEADDVLANLLRQ